MTTELTIEMAPFSVASGITEQELLAASATLEREFLSRAAGYLGRMLVRRDTGDWADIVFWESAALAASAMAAASASTACRAYFACMQAADHANPGNGVSLFRAVESYGSLQLSQ